MMLLTLDKENRLILQCVMSNKSSTASDDEKKATNLANALVYHQKSIFQATDRVTETLIKKAKNSLYKKYIVFVNVSNDLENKIFLSEKLPLNTPFVKKKRKHYPFDVIQFSQTFPSTTS